MGDLNGYVVNAYRAIQQAPDETARYAWWPSFHADLTARHRWLVRWGKDGGGLARLMDDPEWFDPKAAGWWIWGISNWIGISHFCAAAFGGTHREQITHCDATGQGMGTAADRVNTPGGDDKIPATFPEMVGRGVHSARHASPALTDHIPVTSLEGARRVQLQSRGTPFARAGQQGPDRWVPWFRWLSERLAGVTIINRDWASVLRSRTLLGDFYGHTVGVFLDPPYPTEGRSGNLYALDNGDEIFPAVWQWAKEHGDRPNFRIAICGLDGHFDNIPDGWRIHRWRNGGMQSRVRRDELVLFSPHCHGDNQPALL